MYRNILLPTDGSPLARAAIERGVELARALGARVTGFHAAPPATPLAFKGLLPQGFIAPTEHAALIEKAADRYLGVVEKVARAAGVDCKIAYATSDYPAEAILAAARKYKCDLIFVASHGRRGFRESLLGTETQKLLSQSKVPVLVHR